MSNHEVGIILVAFFLSIVFLSFIIVYIKRYVRVPPNKAMVVFGSGMGRRRGVGKDGRPVTLGGFEIIVGGGKFIAPVTKDYAFLPLNVTTLDVQVKEIVTDVTRSGAKLNVKAVAQVKVSGEQSALQTASEALLGKTELEINDIALKTLEGHVRGVCAKLTIEEVNSDRDKFAAEIQRGAAGDLANMGMEIRSFVIKEIEDEHGYLDALGRKRTAEVIRDARVGEANANREAVQFEASAAREAEKANAEAEAQVALYHRDRDITRQRAESEVEKERANKEIAYNLQNSIRQQELVVQQTTIQIREREKQVEVQQQEVRRKEQEQTAEKVVPAKAMADAVAAEADGEKRRLIIVAEGEKQRAILTAEGERQRLEQIAEGQAAQIRQTGTAEADIIKLKGLAEAEAIKAKGLAEAIAMEKKAEAWEKYGKAAVTEMIVSKLPEMIGEASKSLAGTEKMIIMGQRGPADLVGSVVDIAAQAPALVKTLTGMDIGELVQKVKELTK